MTTTPPASEKTLSVINDLIERLTFDKDMISSLPDNIIEMILVRLPFNDAISTSFLSRYWRYKWRSVPDIIFDYNAFPPFYNEDVRRLRRFDKINQVLLLHEGDVRTFHVYYIRNDVSTELTSWFDHLVGARVQKIALDFGVHNYHLIPSSLFCCEKLITLDLCHCKIALPDQSFNGFKSLTTLALTEISFRAIDLERLIKACPLLNDLTIRDVSPKILKIHAPNLRSLTVNSYFTYLNLNETPMITSAFISKACDFIDVLGSLAGVEDLQLFYNTIMYLRMDDGIKFNRMKELTLDLRLDCIEETETVLSILKNSYALECLRIYCECDFGRGNPFSAINHFWKGPNIFSIKLNQLKIFNMHNVSETAAEVRFIEFVLGNAPFLEEICITPNCFNDDGVVLDFFFIKQVLSFPRASAKAILRLPHTLL